MNVIFGWYAVDLALGGHFHLIFGVLMDFTASFSWDFLLVRRKVFVILIILLIIILDLLVRNLFNEILILVRILVLLIFFISLDCVGILLYSAAVLLRFHYNKI